MKKVFLDTNAFLRFLLNDIPDQKNEVKNLLLEAKKGSIALSASSIVIFEINFVLFKYYHKTKEEIIEALESLIAIPYIHIQSKDIFNTAIVLYKSTTLSLVDCFLCIDAKQNGAELFTFDKKLKKLLF